MRFLTGVLLLSFLLFSPAAAFTGEEIPEYSLTVRVDPAKKVVRGTSVISLPAGQAGTISISGLRILSASINGVPVDPEPGVPFIPFQSASGDDELKIEYVVSFGYAGTADGDTPNIVSSESISLTSGWYPELQGLAKYHLTALIPERLEAISEADEITVRETGEGEKEFSFSFPHPLESVSLVAGQYKTGMDEYRGKKIYTYLFPEDTGLGRVYIEYAKKYLELFSDSYGDYPYQRFSIVEGAAPTGSSFPTFTLIGKDVLTLPFIPEVSLGHEILHQWFGNMVYIDYENGNWSEGLTTYLADHRLEEMKNEEVKYRKEMLVKFQSYVTPANDFPLKDFTVRTDEVSGAIGYEKAAMVFRMLENLVGKESFQQSLRKFIEDNRFKRAAWSDIRTAFESVSGQDLSWFFSQWLEGAGMPELDIQNVRLTYEGSRAVVGFDAVQKAEKFRIHLPVVLETEDGETVKLFVLEERSDLEMETGGFPLKLIADRNYDVFRKLSEDEFPPVISRLLGDKSRFFVLPESAGKEYEAVAGYLTSGGFEEKIEGGIGFDDVDKSSFIIFGADSMTAKRLFGTPKKIPGDFSLSIRENPFGSSGVIALADGAGIPDIINYVRRIPHYGKYTTVVFEADGNVKKEVGESLNGIQAVVTREVPGVEISRIISAPRIIDKIDGTKIIYVGEKHDSFEHHRVQMDVIRRLHKKGYPIAIGMEMFQKPFQKVLDDYIEGLIGEKEFLKKSEYFERWGFDYNLYREILLYAREVRIPVVALNIRKEIVSRVAKEGLYALPEDDLKELPEDMDFSNTQYRETLKDFFGMHQGSGERSFDFFYQAQVLWDESMAHSIDAYLKENPERRMVVLAGNGHLAFGYGIPQRAHRLNGLEYSIVLNDSGVEENIADFVLFPEPVEYPQSPKLMVLLKKEEGKVKIAGFSPGSISEKAGLKEGDIILSMDGAKIEDVADVKIFLLDKKEGETITVTIIRDRVLFGPAEKEYQITL
jgi:uncharacterized iron-regulated protein